MKIVNDEELFLNTLDPSKIYKEFFYLFTYSIEMYHCIYQVHLATDTMTRNRGR